MISLRNFRIAIGSMVLISHFLCIVIIIAFGFYFRLELGDMAAKAVSATPIAGIYSYLYYRYIVKNTEETAREIGKVIGRASFYTQVGVIGLFCLALIFFPVLIFTVGDMDQLNLWVGGIETVFGAYIGRSFNQFFPSEVLGEGDPVDSSKTVNLIEKRK